MDKTKATKLKEEGNSFFVKKDYKAAHAKYSEALQYDEHNAVLYCNRAACAQAFKQFGIASTDATKATELDPKYPKAWARLAAARIALSDVERGIECWTQALAVLPKENLTPSEGKQKAEYEAGLQSAQALKAAPPPAQYIMMEDGISRAPWVRAKAMLPELRIQGPARFASSAWVIAGAYEDWTSGMKMMKLQKIESTPEGIRLGGQCGAIGELTNAILRDSRIFHMTDNNWVELYNNQVKIETQTNRAWQGKSADLIAQAPQLQKTEGWDVVRPAIATTVRAWIMRAFVSEKASNKYEYAFDLYDEVLEVLRWGRRVWRSVPSADRGVVFEPTFVRGVRSLRLHTMMQMVGEAAQAGTTSSKCTLEDIYEEAQEIIRDIEEDLKNPPQTEMDPGFVSSFFVYPKGQAYAMQGFYHNQMAKRCAMLGQPLEASIDHSSKAAKAYFAAASTYPEDDETHPYFLNCSLDALYKCRTPIKALLPVMRRIRESTPKIKAVWEHSAMAHEGRDKALQQALWAEEDVLKALAEGKFTMEDPVMLERPQLPN